MTTPFETYIARIAADFKGGKATELTYRSTLEALLESLAPGVEASSDPKHVACGAPDFIVEQHKVPVGYVETKDIGADLGKVERSDQLKRYRASLHNLILTDYLEFRWYVHGERRLTARLATTGQGNRLIHDRDGIATAARLFTGFYETQVPVVGTPKELAQRMAALTQIVRDLIVGSLREEGETGVFHQQLETFRRFLLPAVTPQEFADMYAQTMAYGLFAARVNMPEGQPFDRTHAYLYLPPANPFLRRLFLDVGEELDGTPIAPFLDDLARLIDRANMEAILRDFGQRTRTEDPVVHFYETFLAAYDPRLRKSRGVYYTPEPVVQFIVRSVDHLLKTSFHKPLGLADPEVLLLDPATGTGTFLYFVIRHIHETQVAHGQEGVWDEYVRTKLLPRVFGFELLMAPYAVAHLKLGLLLRELCYTFTKGERLGVYLTNTLEQGEVAGHTLGLAGYLSEEGSAATQVRNQAPIMVVLGNPPYSKSSANQSPWIEDLMEDYKTTVRDAETQIQALSDDYVKFIRFAHWRIRQTGKGIVGFVTNNGYLDGPLFRDMRKSLMESFGRIWILNLHGDSRKQETSPDGTPDKNVFDIQQGVAVLLMSASPADEGRGVYHADVWGSREQKYEFLTPSDLGSIDWTPLSPAAPLYLFVPVSLDVQGEWDKAYHLYDVFGHGNRDKDNHIRYGAGFVTQQDEFAIAFEPNTLYQRVAELLDPSTTESALRERYNLCTTAQWNFNRARKELAKADLRKATRQIAYRPFDYRYTIYDRNITTIRRERIMGQMEESNLALLTTRRVTRLPFTNVFVANKLVEYKIASHDRNTIVFPLYFYPNPGSKQPGLFVKAERQPNLSPRFTDDLGAALRLRFILDGAGDLEETFGPEDVFHYTYAVFHSPTYRTRYAEFLKMDFPRLPLTSDRRLFATLVGKGAELGGLHLLKSPVLDIPITTFPVSGSNEVERVRYEVGRVWINPTQHFGGVPEAVWEFQIGGYQVCGKWLKDRKGRRLSADDISHYQRIVVALNEAIRLMREIDEAIPRWPIE